MNSTQPPNSAGFNLQADFSSSKKNISIYLDAAIGVFQSVIDNNGITPDDPRVYQKYGEEKLCVGFRKKKAFEIPKGTFAQRINEVTSTILVKLLNASDEEIKQNLNKQTVSILKKNILRFQASF